MGDLMLARKALLVDDSKSARFVLSKLLQRHDFEVEMVDSAEAALEFLKEHSPDAIFMDHLMPGMDGLVATAMIKKDPATAHIPVVMCTSNDGEEYLKQAKSHGAIGTLPKPPTSGKLEAVLAAVDEAIDNLQEKMREDKKAQEKAEDSVTVAAMEARSPTESEVTSQEPAVSADALIAMIEPQVEKQMRILRSSIDEKLAELRGELLEAIKLNTDAIASNIGRQEAEERISARFDAQTKDLSEQIERAKRELQDELLNSDAMFKQIREVAEGAAESISNETAMEVSREVVRSSVEEAIDPVLEEKISLVADQLGTAQKTASKRAGILAIFAGAVGVVSAAFVYFMVS